MRRDEAVGVQHAKNPSTKRARRGGRPVVERVAGVGDRGRSLRVPPRDRAPVAMARAAASASSAAVMLIIVTILTRRAAVVARVAAWVLRALARAATVLVVTAAGCRRGWWA